MTDINVCLSCDDNYSKYAGVVVASILANANNDDNLSIYILDGGISDKHKEEIKSLKSIKDYNIEFVSVNPDLFVEYTKIKTHSYITLPTYYRLKLPSLLPNVKKIIYLDCDMIVLSSLADLFNTDMGTNLVAGVQDINKNAIRNNPSYVNAGMLMFNLNKMRKNNTEEMFLNWTKANFDSIKTGDQTIINKVCYGKILLLDKEWNVQSSNFVNRSSYTNNPKIIHYVAKNKPWSGKCFSYHKNLYFKYLQLTPWKLEENELKKALKSTMVQYVKYRPFFMLRPRFYYAFFRTYIWRK